MTALCPLVRGSFEDYRRDALPAPQRRILRDHLAACPECHALATSGDPTMLFARPVPAEPVPAEDAQRILSNVRTAVGFAETERRLRRSSRRKLASAAAAAAAFGALLLIAPSEGGRDETLQNALSRPTPATGTGATGTSARGNAPEVPPAVQPATLAGTVETEGISNDATVYEWNPGAGREEPRVVWIVDRGLDI